MDGDRFILTLFFSDQAWIVGEVTGLSNKEFVRFKENPNSTIAGYMTSGSFGPENKTEDDDRRRTNFKPTHLVLIVTNALNNTLQAIRRAINCGAGPGPMFASDELRHLTIEALGDDNHRNTLVLNDLLKSKKDAILGIRKEVMRVDIEHSTGALRFTLDETEAIADEDGNTVHQYIVPDGRVGASMAVADIKHSSFLLSGVSIMKRLHLLKQ